MRATRFRLQAGLISWKKRMGSDVRNEKILSFLPEQCKTLNSTISFRDLLPAEQESVEKALKGSAPGRKRNSNKAKKAEESEDEDPDAEGDTDPDVDPQDVVVMTRKKISPPSRKLLPRLSHTRKRAYVDLDSHSSDSEPDSPPSKKARKGTDQKGGKTIPKNLNLRTLTLSKGSEKTKGPKTPSSKVSARSQPAKMGKKSGKKASEKTPAESSSSSANGYLTQEESDVLTGNDHIAARRLNTAIILHPQTRKPPIKTSDISPEQDFRSLLPNSDPDNVEDNIQAIQEALAITRYDLFKRTGWRASDTYIADHKDQAYAQQWSSLQCEWACLCKQRPIPKLYYMKKWSGGFRGWKVEDSEEAIQMLTEANEMDI